MLDFIFLLFTRSYYIYFLYENKLLNSFYTIISKVCVILVVGVFLLKIFSQEKINGSFFCLVILLYIFQLISTLLGKGSVQVLIRSFYPILGMNCFLSLLSDTQSHIKDFIKTMANFMFIMIIANFVLLVAMPEGYFNEGWGLTYLIGIENQISISFLIGFLFCLLDFIYNGCFWKILIYSIIYCISSLIIWSGSGLVAMAALFIGIFPSCWKILKRVDLFYIAIFMFFIIFMVICLGVSGFFEKEPFSFIFEKILKKDSTLTGRIGIWENVLEQWEERSVWGYGIQESVDQFIGHPNYPDTKLSAHNQFLQFLWTGGLVSFFCFILIIAKVSGDLKKCKNKKVEATFKLVLLALFVVLMSEAASFDSVFFLLGFATNIGFAKDDKYETLLLKNEEFSF